MTDQPDPRAGLFAPSPFRLNLEQQRKRAKELLAAWRGNEPAARARIERHHPGSQPALRLADAQVVIARELGLPSWPRLKAHILAMDAARARILADAPPPDDDTPTLHIRCGSDIRVRLNEAGFTGDFLEYSDAFCQGPVVASEDWLERRAIFLADAYGPALGRRLVNIRELRVQEETALHEAAARYRRVVLWFEHDSYDQLTLVRCLACFADAAPAVLELISLDRYPGAARFIGLGQLPPEALRLLWSTRQPVSARQLQTGRAIWPMVRAEDPTNLARVAALGLAELPYLAAALRRHCEELPWLDSGLSLTERLTLQLLSEQSHTVGQLFGLLMREREKLPWLGDVMYLHIVQNMKHGAAPVFTASFDGDDHRWPRERLTITDLGRSVLSGAVDWLSLAPPDRWVGGVHVDAAQPCWRWDGRAGTVRLVPPPSERPAHDG